MKCEEKEHQNDPTIYIAGQYDSNNCPSVDINDELISSRLDNPISNFEGNIVNEAFESNHLLKDKNTSLTNKKKWTSEEDELLKKAVMIYGKKNWCSVCTLVPGRNSKQC
ncbi:hypothetical protein TRFO_19328 [Tritrichomonas foetus]|uniref:Uncharacterized protein n=1 Tax=Tritrichomonas foetus TaxID=1144522 RepID=A0A1J4KNH0_9EUKA|nr:hypothetical protein TRFO_19328 [Tritrichomonas foetus]|eukprot:OHT11332.1 hypothetical protein TRFO_19328 [Tritrichomonas foetus]